MQPYYAQKCRYCEAPAVVSLLYGRKSGEYLPCCVDDQQAARAELRKKGRALLDTVEIDMRRVPTSEGRMASALAAPPSYPEPDASSNFGLRVNPRRAQSAVSEAGVSPTPIQTVTGKDQPETFLAALGKEWKNIHAFRVNTNRITVTVDGQKFTVYSRRG